MLMMLACATRKTHSITAGRTRELKGSPADADDARPCGSLKQFNRWGRTAMRALGSPADGKERLKGSPADADDARPSINGVELLCLA